MAYEFLHVFGRLKCRTNFRPSKTPARLMILRPITRVSLVHPVEEVVAMEEVEMDARSKGSDAADPHTGI